MPDYPIDKIIEALTFVKKHPKMYFQNASELHVFLQGFTLGCKMWDIPETFSEVLRRTLEDNDLPNSLVLALEALQDREVPDYEITNILIDLHIQIWETYRAEYFGE